MLISMFYYLPSPVRQLYTLSTLSALIEAKLRQLIKAGVLLNLRLNLYFIRNAMESFIKLNYPHQFYFVDISFYSIQVSQNGKVIFLAFLS